MKTTTTYFLIFISLILVIFSCKKEDETPFEGNLQGRVYNSATRQPLEGVTVRVRQKGSAGVLESVITTTEGLFTLENLTTAEYIIEFSRPGFRFAEEQVNLRAGMVSGLSIYLEPYGAVLDVSPVFLDFKQNLSILAVDIRTLTDSKLLWSIAEEIPWLTVGQLSGTLNAKSESQSVPLRVDRTGINPGRHSQGLVVVSNGGSRNVNLTITVGDDNLPLLQVNELFVDFNNDQNTHTIEIRNAGRETLNWSVIEAMDWLSVTPTSSSLNAGGTSNLTLLVNRTGLIEGRTYTGYLDIQSNGGTAKVLLNMNVGTNVSNVTATQFATNVSETFATLNGIVAINETESNVSFEYGTNTAYGNEIASLQNPLSGTGLVNVNANLIGLQSNTTYHYRLKVQNAGGTAFGRNVTFTTSVSLPSDSQTPGSGFLNAEYFLENPERRVQWWNGLEDQWKKALNWVLEQGEVTTMPSDLDIINLFQRENLSILRSPFDNLSFQVTNLSGIQNFTNLKDLRCFEHQIRSLEPIRNLINLTHLNVSSNQISSLEPISNLTNLQTLAVGNNQISSLELIKNLTNLQKLYFDSNQISNLEPIKNLNNLEILWCPVNQISSLEPITNLTNLTTLFVSYNQISSLELIRNLTNLQKLHCDFNQISSLEPINSLTNLTNLYCDSNQISSLEPINSLANLTTLYFDSNQISSLEPIRNLTNLRELRVRTNQLTNLVGLENLRNLRNQGVYLKEGNNIPNSEIQRIEALLGITIN